MSTFLQKETKRIKKLTEEPGITIDGLKSRNRRNALDGLNGFVAWAESADEDKEDLPYDYTVSDCLTDLMHYIDTRTDTTVDETINRARMHFESERTKEAEAPTAHEIYEEVENQLEEDEMDELTREKTT